VAKNSLSISVPTSAAVDRHELTALFRLVNGACHHFLAGACLPRKKHGKPVAPRFFNQPADCRNLRRLPHQRVGTALRGGRHVALH
jgi:hypothetical protein